MEHMTPAAQDDHYLFIINDPIHEFDLYDSRFSADGVTKQDVVSLYKKDVLKSFGSYPKEEEYYYRACFMNEEDYKNNLSWDEIYLTVKFLNTNRHPVSYIIPRAILLNEHGEFKADVTVENKRCTIKVHNPIELYRPFITRDVIKPRSSTSTNNLIKKEKSAEVPTVSSVLLYYKVKGPLKETVQEDEPKVLLSEKMIEVDVHEAVELKRDLLVGKVVEQVIITKNKIVEEVISQNDEEVIIEAPRDRKSLVYLTFFMCGALFLLWQKLHYHKI